MRTLCLLTFVALAGCSATDSAPERGLRVLYVGNSLTYTHDLPAVVGELAALEGRPYHAEDLSRPNFGLQDHLATGEPEAHLASGEWDVVVLQQGPSTLPESREILVLMVARFSDIARQNGAEPAVYQVWPPVGTPIERSEASYAAAAVASDALLLPAGHAWRLALEADPGLSLYGPDGFHPSRLGTALAALAVYGGLFGSLPDALPPSLEVGGETLVLSREQATRLLRAAQAALPAEGR